MTPHDKVVKSVDGFVFSKIHLVGRDEVEEALLPEVVNEP